MANLRSLIDGKTLDACTDKPKPAAAKKPAPKSSPKSSPKPAANQSPGQAPNQAPSPMQFNPQQQSPPHAQPMGQPQAQQPGQPPMPQHPPQPQQGAQPQAQPQSPPQAHQTPPNGNPMEQHQPPTGQQPGQAGHFPSPAGQHVATNIQDPYGATKQELDELNQAKLNYEMKKAQLQMKLAPVQHVVDGIKQMHEMDDPNQNPDAQMGYTDPNDPTGMGGGNMAMSPQAGAKPGMMPPQNGAMPGMPGVPPGQPKEAIRPFKLGMPKPGMGMPGQVAGNPSQQFNPSAPKPPGAGSMPGASGPGSPNVQNQVKKAQSGGKKSGGSNSNGKVAIHVHADSVSSSPAKRTVMSYAGADSLRSAGHRHKVGESCEACDGNKMKAYGTSDGVRKAWESRGRGKKEPIVDINDKRGFSSPAGSKRYSKFKPAPSAAWKKSVPEGAEPYYPKDSGSGLYERYHDPEGYILRSALKALKGGVVKSKH